MNAGALMTEWGATDNVKAIGMDVEGADDALMGWTYWAYKHWDDPTTADASHDLFTDDANLGSVKKDNPQATAGMPTKIDYDTTSGRFSMTCRPDRSIAAPTRIFVSPLTAPKGYDVRVTGGRATKNGSYVQVRATSPGLVTGGVVRDPDGNTGPRSNV